MTVGVISNPNISALPYVICPGDSSTLFATGNGTIKWWDSIIGGNLLDSTLSGGIFKVYPTITSTYYAELSNSCGISTRTSVTVSVNIVSQPANNILSTYASVCTSMIDTLTVFRRTNLELAQIGIGILIRVEVILSA